MTSKSDIYINKYFLNKDEMHPNILMAFYFNGLLTLLKINISGILTAP